MPDTCQFTRLNRTTCTRQSMPRTDHSVVVKRKPEPVLPLGATFPDCQNAIKSGAAIIGHAEKSSDKTLAAAFQGLQSEPEKMRTHPRNMAALSANICTAPSSVPIAMRILTWHFLA